MKRSVAGEHTRSLHRVTRGVVISDCYKSSFLKTAPLHTLSLPALSLSCPSLYSLQAQLFLFLTHHVWEEKEKIERVSEMSCLQCKAIGVIFLLGFFLNS